MAKATLHVEDEHGHVHVIEFSALGSIAFSEGDVKTVQVNSWNTSSLRDLVIERGNLKVTLTGIVEKRERVSLAQANRALTLDLCG